MSMKNKSLHEFILTAIKEDLLSYLQSQKRHHDYKWKDSELLGLIFKNYRISRTGPKGLRLSYIGDRMCVKHFANYTYKLASEIQNSAMIGLDKNMIWPYYVGKEHINFYSQDDAAWFQLNGSDINSFTDFI